MDVFRLIADRKIEEAMEEGAFDNLPGKGKPLNLTGNPYEDPALRMAHHVLRNNGFAPPWILEAKEIEAEVEAARAALHKGWAQYQRLSASRKTRAQAETVWRQSLKTFRLRVEELNRRIQSYNLKAPAHSVHRLPLNAEREIEQIETANNANLREF
jgi:DnaJ family protein C protein 28